MGSLIIHSKKFGNKEVLIDDNCIEMISQYRWMLQEAPNTFYAYTMSTNQCGSRTTIKMHRLIMGFPIGLNIDHKNHNGLDNRIDNLRLATVSQNLINSKKQVNNTSGYKGVSFNKSRGMFRVRVYKDRKAVYQSHFDNLIDAAMAYNEAAKNHYGEFANLNVI